MAAVLGSVAFLPLLLRSPHFATFSSIKRLNNSTLAMLSFLLRGGTPKLDELSPIHREFAEAAIFGAHVIIPFALRSYLVSASKAFDHRPLPGDRNQALYTGENPATSHPQPLCARTVTGAGGIETGRPKLEFGLMSGYEARRRPHMVPDLWTLRSNYTKGLHPEPAGDNRDSRTQGQKENKARYTDLNNVFDKIFEKSQILTSPDSTKPCVELEVNHMDVLTLSNSYARKFGLSPNDSGVLSILDAVRRGQRVLTDASGSDPQIPTTEYLRSRQREFQEAPLPALPSLTANARATVRDL